MRKANDESPDSPFVRNTISAFSGKTKTLKSKLCGGVSANSPSYFHLRYIDILDEKSRTQELLKGYKLAEKNDFKLTHHPELFLQDKKYFTYEDFKSNGGKNVFDYSSVKMSNLIDLLADKRPDFKKKSMFYKKYNEKLGKDGFGLTRGMFTLESNSRKKFSGTCSSRFFAENCEKEFFYTRKGKNSMQNQIISEQAKKALPLQFRSGKAGMTRYLGNGKN